MMQLEFWQAVWALILLSSAFAALAVETYGKAMRRVDEGYRGRHATGRHRK